jgi:hypothetical protein
MHINHHDRFSEIRWIKKKKKKKKSVLNILIKTLKKRTPRKFNMFRSGFAWHDAYTSIGTCLSWTNIFSIESMIDSNMHVSHHLFRLSFFFLCFLLYLSLEETEQDKELFSHRRHNFVHYCHSLLRWWTYPVRFQVVGVLIIRKTFFVTQQGINMFILLFHITYGSMLFTLLLLLLFLQQISY